MVIYRRDDQNNISNNNIDLWKLSIYLSSSIYLYLL